MARNRNKRKSRKTTQDQLRRLQIFNRNDLTDTANKTFGSVLGTIGSNRSGNRSSNPVFNPLINRQNLKSAYPKTIGKATINASNVEKDMIKALLFFKTNPDSKKISTFLKDNPDIMKNEDVQRAVLSDITDPAQLGIVARGIGEQVKDFDVSSVFQERASAISQAPQGNIPPTNPNVSVTPTGQSNLPADSVYKNIYVPPNGGTQAQARPSSASTFNPVLPQGNQRILPTQQQVVDPVQRTFRPVQPSFNSVDTGLPPAVAEIGGNAPTAINPPIQASTQPQFGLNGFTPVGAQPTPTTTSSGLNIPGFQPIGDQFAGQSTAGGNQPSTPLTFDNVQTDNTPKTPSQLEETRKLLFGDDKNLGFLTGGAQVASGIFGIYNGYKQTKLAREQYEFKKNSFKTQFANQAKLLNNAIRKQEHNNAAIRFSNVKNRTDRLAAIDNRTNDQFNKHRLDPNAAQNL